MTAVWIALWIYGVIVSFVGGCNLDDSPILGVAMIGAGTLMSILAVVQL